MPDTRPIELAAPCLTQPEPEPTSIPEPPRAGPAPFVTIVTVEGRLIRVVREGAGLALEIETGRGRYVAALDRFQAGAFRAAMAEG